MPRTRGKFWLPAVAAGLAATLLSSGLGPATPAVAGRRTVVYRGVTIYIASQTVTRVIPDSSDVVGTLSDYTADIVDSAGKHLGVMTGHTYVYGRRASDNHVMVLEADDVTLPEGTFVDGGQVDANAAWHNEYQTISASGTGGSLHSKAGTLSYISVTPTYAPYEWQAKADIVLR